jgi:heptosyltransferase-1
VSAEFLLPENLLVVRLGAMGDIVHTLHAVAALRQALPDARIGWVVEERWAELLCRRGNPRSGPRTPSRPLVDFVHSVDTKRWRKSLISPHTQREIAAALREVRKQKYQLAADFQGALKTAVIARCAGAETVVGMEHPREAPARTFYQHRIATSGAHVIEQYRSIAEAVVDTSLPSPDIVFPTDEKAEASIRRKLEELNEHFVLINPGAGWGAKQWPTERYGEVAKALAGSGVHSLINFGPGEEKLALAVQSASDGTACPVSCSIAELIALTRRARLFIGGDTGPLHLAAALKIPVVAIFGPTDPARNGPYGTRSIALRNVASRNSLSHTSVPDPGLLNIAAEEVITAARNLLGASRA